MIRRRSPGEPLNIAAREFNAMADAADAHAARRGIIVPPQAAGNTVLIRNDSGASLGRFSILAITGVVTERVDAPSGFLNEQVLTGEAPVVDGTTLDDSGRFVVLQEPIADGSIGRAAISGLTLVYVAMQNEADRFADVINGLTYILYSRSQRGQAEIIWKEPIGDRSPSSSWALCLVRLGRLVNTYHVGIVQATMADGATANTNPYGVKRAFDEGYTEIPNTHELYEFVDVTNLGQSNGAILYPGRIVRYWGNRWGSPIKYYMNEQEAPVQVLIVTANTGSLGASYSAKFYHSLHTSGWGATLTLKNIVDTTRRTTRIANGTILWAFVDPAYSAWITNWPE